MPGILRPISHNQVDVNSVSILAAIEPKFEVLA